MSTRTGIFTVGVAGVYQLTFTAKYVSSSKGRFGAWSDVYVNNTVSKSCVWLKSLGKSKEIQGVSSARGLGWVDFIFACSTVCPILPGTVGILQKRMGSWARWWNMQIKVNPTPVHVQMGHPVLCCKPVISPPAT